MIKPIYTVWRNDGNGQRISKNGVYLEEAKKFAAGELDHVVHSYLILKETDIGLKPIYYKRFNSREWEKVK